MDLLKIGVLVFSIGLSAVIFYFRKRIAKLASYGYIGLFMASLLGNATILFPAPVFALVIVGGRVLNPYFVGLVTSLGAALGELTGYFAGYGGQAIVGEHPQLEEWIRVHGFLTILVLAAIPNPFFDVAGIIAGMNHLPIDQFLLATFLGTCVKYVLLALGGKRFLPK